MARSLTAASAARIAAAAFVVALVLNPSEARAQPASLIADIGQGEPLSSGFFDIIPFSSATITLGGLAYFFADDQIHGKELWSTDGTQVGSHIVIDLCPGACSGGGAGLTVWQGNLYFWASDGEHLGGGLWRSDGMAAGTQLLAAVQPARFTLLSLGANLYFAAEDRDHGWELWRTDGTPSGTTVFRDLVPGPNGSSVYLLGVSASQLYFLALDGSSFVLWHTDGSTVGTAPLPVVYPATLPSRGAFLPGGDLTIASVAPSGHREVWRTDGSIGGTVMLKDFGADSSSLKGFTAWGGSVYFAHNGEIWRTDGSPAGTMLVATIPDAGTVTSEDMVPAGGLLYFAAFTAPLGTELWKSDGSPAGTGLVKDVNPGAADGVSSSLWTYLFGGATGVPLPSGGLFFYAQDGIHNTEPWATDGTEAGTAMLADIAPGSGGSADVLSTPGFLNGRIVFRAFDLPRPARVWQTDGTPAGTQPIVQPNQQVSSQRWPFYGQFTRTANGVLFAADDHQHGVQPWGIDSSGYGAHLIADLSPFNEFNVMGELGGRVLFAPYSGTTSETEIAVTDGVTTAVVQSLPPEGYATDSVHFGDAIYYAAKDLGGYKLWRTDLTATSPTLVFSASGTEQSVSPVAGTTALWIWTYDSSGFERLYQSDGTLGGLQIVSGFSDILCRRLRSDGTWILVRGTRSSPGTSHVDLLSPSGLTTVASFPSAPSGCLSFGDRLVAFVDDGTHGFEPWITDGSTGGTALLKDIAPGLASSESVYLGLNLSDGRFYFVADDGSHGREMWSSDGTEAGTGLLADIMPGASGVDVHQFTSAGHRVFFPADDGTHGQELWSSDGTPGGTHLASDLRPGAASPVIQDGTGIDGLFLFSATDGIHGRELFASDGSLAGTRLVQDIAPGADPSSPTGFAAIGPNVYFYANDATHGFEPWKLPRRTLANAVPAALGYYTVAPCRLVDTRTTTPLVGGQAVRLAIAGNCDIPATAQAVSVNITTLDGTVTGAIAVYPTDDPGPGVGLAAVTPGRIRATNAIVRLSLDDRGELYARAELPTDQTAHLVLDVSGYFAP